jgi:hypothetical protein
MFPIVILVAPLAALAQPAPPPGDPATTPADPVPPANVPPPETPPPAEKKSGSPINVKYDKKTILTTEDESFKLQINLRLQFRFDTTRSTADGAEFLSAFSIPRGRVIFDGFAFSGALGYKAEFDFAGNGRPQLKDIYLEQKLGSVRIRAGQYKRPFNRQEVVSDFSQIFVERAIDNTFIGGGRDIGVMVHNDYEKVGDGLEWAVALFNGSGDRPTQTVTCEPGETPADPPECTVSAPTTIPGDWLPTAIARVGFASGGIKGFSEGDLEGGPLRWAAALQYRAAGLRDFDTLVHTVGVDGVVKVSGFDLQLGAFLVKQPDVDPDFTGHLQAGYFVTPKKAQITGRFAFAPAGDETQIEARGGFNWYWSGHEWKWTTDVGMVQVTGGGDPTLQLRTQLQFSI